MKPNPVGWFEIYVSDLQRAKKFYESVLNVQLEKLENAGSADIEMWSFPMNPSGGGASGALAKMDQGPTGNGTIVYTCATTALRKPRVRRRTAAK